MKKTTIYLLLFIFSLGIPSLQAQEETPAEKIEKLEKEKEKIIAEEKEALKKEVEKINLRLEKKEIDWEKAEELKSEAAKKHALNIENRVAIIDNQIALLSRDGKEKDPDRENDEWGDDDDDDEDDWHYKSHYSRTTTHLVVAVGFNNALLEDQSLNDSDFKIGGSRFFELGMAWKTRVFEQSNWLRLRYGFSFQFNGLKPTDNRYFVENGDLTQLQEHELDLDKSKFRMDNLVFPVHFELGPSKKIETERSVWFSTRNQLRIGLGGYAGFNIGQRQKLKFEENGEKVKQKLKAGYNTNEFIYGLSGYLGWGGTALYVKYDLNPIFDDPNPELRNVSLGLRFDVN
ncbi:hypothetical protein [Salinimicrobium flavum]|uniref:Outer membrane protein beta-barrel domain-containing protein n=1 Tax=Salinimicrobium flavum TaxID=1737065 RepID=A0ABW5ISP5_9FLAO